jgi:hypothetical protein
MNGRYQVVAGPTWPGNAERDSGYTLYRISIEEATGNSRKTIFQKDIPFAELPKDMVHRSAPEIATFDMTSKTVHFDLGTHHYKYKIEAE